MNDKRFIFDGDLIRSKLLPLNSTKRLSLNDKNFVNSAIIFLLIPHDNNPYDLVLIRRTKNVKDKHSGEMSFPGGKFDPSDESLEETALRECEEELGIPRNRITLLGSFDDHITPKCFIITPIVGYIEENQEMIKQDKEVQEILKIPVDFFADKKKYRERTYQLADDTIAVGKYVFRDLNGKKYIIFGATSHIIVNFIERVYNLQLMKPGARRLNCVDLNKQKEKIDLIASDVKKKFLN